MWRIHLPDHSDEAFYYPLKGLKVLFVISSRIVKNSRSLIIELAKA